MIRQSRHLTIEIPADANEIDDAHASTSKGFQYNVYGVVAKVVHVTQALEVTLTPTLNLLQPDNIRLQVLTESHTALTQDRSERTSVYQYYSLREQPEKDDTNHSLFVAIQRCRIYLHPAANQSLTPQEIDDPPKSN